MCMFKVRLNVRFVGGPQAERIGAAERVLNYLADVDPLAELATTADIETFAFYTTLTTTTDELFPAAEAASKQIREAGERAGFVVNKWPDDGDLPWAMFYKSIEVAVLETRLLASSPL